MISSVLAMLMMAPSPAVIATARRDYSMCLDQFMKKGIKDKMETAAFESSLVPACAAKEAAFRTVVVAADIAVGIKRADAEENARFEIDDIQANIKETFRDTMTPRTAASTPTPAPGT
jgi:hypothetical protein